MVLVILFCISRLYYSSNVIGLEQLNDHLVKENNLTPTSFFIVQGSSLSFRGSLIKSANKTDIGTPNVCLEHYFIVTRQNCLIGDKLLECDLFVAD